VVKSGATVVTIAAVVVAAAAAAALVVLVFPSQPRVAETRPAESIAQAQQSPPALQLASAESTFAAFRQPQPPPAGQSDAELVLTLIRLTLGAVHQANVTGNYTVLRDLGAPGFRDAHSAADLARIFGPIRDAKIDLGTAVLLEPKMSKVELTEQKMLHLAGTLATKPVPVAFELMFQPIDGVWRIFGIAVAPMQQPQPPTATAAPPRQAPAKGAPKQNAKQ
jgi:hypothetical protein